MQTSWLAWSEERLKESVPIKIFARLLATIYVTSWARSYGEEHCQKRDLKKEIKHAFGQEKARKHANDQEKSQVLRSCLFFFYQFPPRGTYPIKENMYSICAHA